MPEICFEKCNGNPETCEVVEDLVELEAFYGTVSELDESYSNIPRITTCLFNACANGVCPGQNPEVISRLTAKIFDERRT